MLDNEEKKATFELIPRRAIIVWVYSLRQLKVLRRYGVVTYISRKMKYVLLYMNEEAVSENEVVIEKLHFVRSIERSYRPDIEMNFGDKIGEVETILEEDDGFEVEELSTKITLAENV